MIYILACEARCRIFNFDIHYRFLSVMGLIVHLLGDNILTLRDSDKLTSILGREGIEQMMFTKWMRMNSISSEAK